MASIKIKFHANTTGVHNIGYRNYENPINTYTIVNVTCPVIGDYEIDIPVTGNLYCAYEGIEYTGYVIAACQDQTDSNGDGIPNFGVTFTVLIDGIKDPCEHTLITCIGVPINKVDSVDLGVNCIPPGIYTLLIDGTTPGDEITPATVNVTITAGGIVDNITIVNPGVYKTTPIATLDPAVVSCDVVPSFQILMETKGLSIELSDYACLGSVDISGTSTYQLEKGESLYVCADPTTLSELIPLGYSAANEGNCRCQECSNVIVSTSALSGNGKITYQTCWDDTNPYGIIMIITQTIQFDEVIDLGCIIMSTLHIDEGSLGNTVIITETPCGD